MTHKLSSACAELILSYHLFSQLIFFTQLVPVTSLLWGCVFFLCFVWVVFVCVCVFVLRCVCFWFFVFRFLFSDDVTSE